MLAMFISSLVASADDSIRDAVAKSLKRIEQGSASYITKRQCFSCHHQAMPVLVMTSAQRRGLIVDNEKLRTQIEFTLATFQPNYERIRKGQAIPGGNTMAAYALLTLDAADHAPDETTSALVEYLLQKQKSDGSWPALAKRPPTEGSSFTNNALALRVLQKYGTEEHKERIELASSKGREWLAKNEPADTEDKVFRLRGLVTAKADQDKIDAARDQLRKDQRDDGGWSQAPDRESDAYATGTVLMALRQADVKPDDAAYAKGIKFLLRTQTADGAWLVETRSRPVQVFFDNGDPGGKSQFASFSATCWATLALLECVPSTSVSVR